jgi:hypothetical protein
MSTSAATPLPLRGALVVAALVAAAAHVPVTGEHLEEAPYMGWAFVVFAAVCGGLALAAAARDSRVVQGAMVLWCGGALATYAATRLVAFPLVADEVGKWVVRWGVVSVVCVAVTVVLCLMALRRRSQLQHA